MVRSPLRTRYSARSVASMSGDSPASMRSGLMAMVESTPVAMRMQSLAVSTLSNISCQAYAMEHTKDPLGTLTTATSALAKPQEPFGALSTGSLPDQKAKRTETPAPHSALRQHAAAG